MPIPAQSTEYHRVLFRDPRELPQEYECVWWTDGDGIRHHRATFPDEMGDTTWTLVANDYPASRFNPAAAWRDALSGGWADRNPYTFLPAPALVQRDAGGGTVPADRGLRVLRTDDGRVFVAGECYVAGEVDACGDFMRQAELRELAQSLVRAGNVRGDVQHDRVDREGISLVESAMVRRTADGEFVVDPDGDSWWVKYEVTDPVIIARIELPADDPNRLHAFSWEAMAHRREGVPVSRSAPGPELVQRAPPAEGAQKAEGEANELHTARAVRVSLVRAGANRRTFVTMSKSADADTVAPEPDSAAGSGLLARLKSIVAPARQLPADARIDADVAAFVRACRVAVEAGEPALVVELADDLGTRIADHAGAELAGSVPWGRAYFARSAAMTLSPEIKAEIEAAAAAAVAKAARPAPPPAVVTVTKADHDAALEAKAAELLAAKAEAEVALKASADEVTALKAEVERLKSAPAAVVGQHTAGEESAEKADPWAELAAGNEARRKGGAYTSTTPAAASRT